jgi:hypothetical protein
MATKFSTRQTRPFIGGNQHAGPLQNLPGIPNLYGYTVFEDNDQEFHWVTDGGTAGDGTGDGQNFQSVNIGTTPTGSSASLDDTNYYFGVGLLNAGTDADKGIYCERRAHTGGGEALNLYALDNMRMSFGARVLLTEATTSSFFIGMKNSNTNAPLSTAGAAGDDMVGFHSADDTGVVTGYADRGGTDATAVTCFTAADDTWYDLAITLDIKDISSATDNGTVTYWQRSGAGTNASGSWVKFGGNENGIPDFSAVALVPVFGVKNNSAVTGSDLVCDYWWVSCDRTYA